MWCLTSPHVAQGKSSPVAWQNVVKGAQWNNAGYSQLCGLGHLWWEWVHELDKQLMWPQLEGGMWDMLCSRSLHCSVVGSGANGVEQSVLVSSAAQSFCPSKGSSWIQPRGAWGDLCISPVWQRRRGNLKCLFSLGSRCQVLTRVLLPSKAQQLC